MPNIDGTLPEGLTRREALKRGAAFGGALLWATPVVQAIGMNRALAQGASGSNCKNYCIKYHFTGNVNSLNGSWSALGTTGSRCFTCPPGYDVVPAGFFNNFTVYTDSGQNRDSYVYVSYPDTCSLADLEDPTPDLYPGSAAARCASDCNYQSGEEISIAGGLKRVKIFACNPFNPQGAKTILDIELIIQCCS